jgi:long-chain acyl-CoA synthetase
MREKVNDDLSRDPKLRAARSIACGAAQGAGGRRRRARARKVRAVSRGEVRDDRGSLFETERCVVEAQVRFEDGRTGSVRADLHINPARTHPAQPERVAA